MKAKSLKELKPNFNSKFFLDTNIWLYLYFPQYSEIAQPLINYYSKIFEEILSKDCMIVTDMVQMSELINLVLHIEHKFYLKINNNVNFKMFRESNEFKNALLNAKILSSNILKYATLRSGIFTSEELNSIVQMCDQADFNDIYFAQFCKKEKSILITHDFDFNALDINISIYTANNRYLS